MHDITGTTQVFGILADPIDHVKTPQRINAVLRARGRDGVMVPIHVDAAGLPAMAQALRQMRNLAGVVVTVPHKTAMVALCDEVTPRAAAIGAVNVVRREGDGRLVGDMLDGDGFVAGLRSAGIEPRGLRVHLAGAGGAASAIAFALAQAGVAALRIANRTPQKAAELAARVAQAVPGAVATAATDDPDDPSGCDLVVNGTSLGMRESDALPLDASRLQAQQTVAEIIMQPQETRLLRAARERGCRIHHGAPMLACQVELMADFMSGAHAGPAMQGSTT